MSNCVTRSIFALVVGCLFSGAIVYGSWTYDGNLVKITTDILEQSTSTNTEFPNLKDSLSSGIVGRTDRHTILYSFQDSTLEQGSSLILIFPDNFDLTHLTVASYSDDDSLNIDFSIDTVIVEGNDIEIRIDTTGGIPEIGSSVQITLDSILNSTTVGEYGVIAISFDSTGMLLAGPTYSALFSLEPDSMVSIQINPTDPQNVTAGNTISYFCSVADQFNNPIEDFDEFWSVVNISEGYEPSGTISEDGVFLGLHSGTSRILCRVGIGADTLIDSTIVYVFHSTLDHYIVTGFPESVIAGHSLTDSIVVTAKDLYENLITDTSTIIWFETTDNRASILPNAVAPDTFVAALTGFEVYQGNNFVFRTPGLQQITLTDSSGTSTTKSILVEAGPPATFNLNVPTHVIAGEEFEISVSNVTDLASNPLNAIAQVELETDGVSPWGDNPQVSSFEVLSGNGSAVQTLVMAETTAVRVTIGSVQRVSDPIIVSNAPADTFKVEMSTPQIVGEPFELATIHAFDPYGNVALDYDASMDTVTITSDGPGTVTPSRLESDTSFIDGLCDLTRFGFVYDGSARLLTFSVSSDSGITGVSNYVEINSAKIELLELDKEQYFRGDTASVTVTITNYGSFDTRIADISLLSSQGSLVVTTYSPELPDTISGNQSRDYELTIVIPVSFDPKMTHFGAAFSASANGQQLTDTSAYLDSAQILSQQNLVYTESSLSPRVVSKEETYSFFCQVQHVGAVNVQLDISSTMKIVSDYGDTLVTQLSNPIPIPANAQPITLFFEDKQIEHSLSSGMYHVLLSLRGTQGIINYSEDISLTDSILIQTPSSIRFVEGSFSPQTAFRGMEIVPELTVVNDGEALLELDTERSLLRLTAGDDEIRFTVDETISTEIEDSTLLKFTTKTVRTSFPLSTNSLTLELYGEENGHTRDILIDLGDNLIDFLQQAAVRLVSLTAHAPNIPNINVGMEFQLTAVVRNESEEELSDVVIGFSSDGLSTFDETMILTSLGVGETDSVVLDVTAATEPNPSELFTASIVSANGVLTGQDATILSPIDNTAAVNIQSGALIDLDARIDGPPAAVDGILSFGQTFHVTSEFANIGQAKVSEGEITLTLPDPAFEIDDPLFVQVSAGEKAGWTITAPRKNGQFDLIVELTQIPLDSNSRDAAEILRGADTIHIAVEEEDLKLRVYHKFLSADIVGPGEQLDLLNLSFTAIADNDQSQIRIDEITLKVLDRNGYPLNASDLFSSVSLDAGFSGQYSGNMADDRIVFGIGDIIISRTDTIEGNISVRLREDINSENFFVSIDSGGIDAIDYTFNVEGEPVVVLGKGGDPLKGGAGYGIVPAELEASFYNYPNPFAAGDEETNIVYSLSQSTDVMIEIFTLIGEKVYSESISAGDAGARRGMNALIWDGTNSRGDVVRNGVYIAVLTLGSGEEVRTKIAVVK